MNASTILLVDDDEVLSQVLQRVLSRQGYNVLSAHNVAQAEQLAAQYRPQLGLLDLCLPDGDGVELGRRLNEKTEKLPLILLTAYPLRLRDRPELATQFNRVLTKPVNLQELRDAIESALHEPTTTTGVSERGRPRLSASSPLPTEVPAQPQLEPVMSTAAPVREFFPEPRSSRGGWIAATLGLAAVFALAFAVWHFELYRALPVFAAAVANERDGGRDPVSAVEGNPDAIALSPEVVERLKITTAAVEPAKGHRPLELAGSLGLDTDKLSRLRSRFAGEVVEIATVPGQEERDATGRTVPRKFRIGDFVKKDDLLAVVWSADFGQKKSDLVDALSQLNADEEFLKRYDSLDRSGLAPVFSILQQRRNTEQSRIAVKRAENNLRTAKMTDAEIEALEKDLRELAIKPLAPEDRGKLKDWARVEVRAPFDGWIVEKNGNPGDIVDTAFDLFKIADLRRLIVQAKVREEDLPLLKHQLPIKWTVTLPTDPDAKPLPGEIFNISAIIDPTEHVAFAQGYIDNPEGRRMRGAQFITASVPFPDPKDTVAIPTAALVEDGTSSIVFVQPDPQKNEFVMKRVKVAKRYADLIQISNDLTVGEMRPLEKGGQGLQTLQVGERVVTQNALGMKAALEDVQSKKP